MTRREFYKTYYRVTDGRYAQHLYWSGDAREKAWRRGQIFMSRTERKLMIVAQYLVLLGTAVCALLGWDHLGFPGLAFFLLGAVSTDFSVVKMEVLYQIYRRDNHFSGILYQAFLGDTDVLWQAVKPYARNRVSGFAMVKRRKLRVRYEVVHRKGRKDVFLELKPSGIRLKAPGLERVWDDPAMSLEDVAKGIADVLNGI